MRTLTIKQAAGFLKTSEDTIAEKIRDEGLPAAKVGRAWVFVDVDLIEWVQKRAKRGRRLRFGRPGDPASLIAAYVPPVGIGF